MKGFVADMWVCMCKGVTDHEIRELLESPLINDVDDVGAACGAGTVCGTCRDEIHALCEEARLATAPVAMVPSTVAVTVGPARLRRAG